MLVDAQGVPLLSRNMEWLRRTKGDLIISYQWTRNDEFPDGIQSMVLMRSVHPEGMFAVTLARVSLYAEPSGLPTPTLIMDCMQIADMLGWSPMDRSAVHRIADAILEGIEDLIKMPPSPDDAFQTAPVVDLQLRINGELVAEEAA